MKNSSSLIWLGAIAVGGFLIYSNWASIETKLGLSSNSPAPTPQPQPQPTELAKPSPAVCVQSGGTVDANGYCVLGTPPAPPTNPNVIISLSSGIWPQVLSAAQSNSFYISGNGLLNGSHWNYLVGQVTGTTPGAIPGDNGQPMTLQSYAKLLTAASMVPQIRTEQQIISDALEQQTINSAILESCLAAAGMNANDQAQCYAKYSSAPGVSGLGIIPADLLLGLRAPSIVPIEVIHHGRRALWTA